ncbi:YwhD family protein [Alicyclobacillus sp. ALC3]|uniref:YwhD family protein n=1 Tax=Alicyclobacillus sp. ALC3 TaxID=2796143 RepID=UPI002378ACC6|nr:YwhD family protein [Alicyclobacillus sp. ALC3]WDL97968.1 YwhD family protein [Alicyclobacillus sp. ALC3]
MQKLNLTSQSKHGSGADDSMRGLSVVFVDGERVFIDNGAIHGKSDLERGMQFVKSLDEVPNPRLVWGFWVTLHRFEGGVQGYYGLTMFALHLDETAKVGYKSLAEQVNQMEKAVKGQVDVSRVPAEVKSRLVNFLQSVRPELWTHAAHDLTAAITETDAS